ncbi:hypothetical protein HanXRQr2_Chr13g0611061 [Helianthus annuus]|uniref:Uncharacterized protein n=1 Tax=Helianthus annuus TaxID=4232 RepID=A0A9K3HC38_HELAN|nr:hypothetical protein HanXRQr2_Chr13g0611061 [Helianthus annuus]KAJ0851135.1 hypothetical protein HanPSC8_Chr13g0588781 [Helianthus annuus]
MDYSEKLIEQRAFDSLGLGFDFASDFRLKFANSCPGGWILSGVSVDIHCDKGNMLDKRSWSFWMWCDC